MKSIKSKVLASVIAVVLAVGMAPSMAFATESDDAATESKEAATTTDDEVSISSEDASTAEPNDEAAGETSDDASDNDAALLSIDASDDSDNSVATISDDEIESGTVGSCAWSIDSEGSMTIEPRTGSSGKINIDATWKSSWPWHSYSSKITSVTVKSGVSASGSIASMFEDCYSLESVDFSNFDTSEATDMSCMFLECSSLTSLNLSGKFSTSNVTDMTQMLSFCTSLTSLDLSNFDTSKTAYFTSMFWGTSSLKALDLSNFDTSNSYQLSWMFEDCSSLETLNISGFDTNNTGSLTKMFDGCESLSEISLGKRFNFDGKGSWRQSYLPSKVVLQGSTSAVSVKWQNTSTGVSYTPSAVPDNTAATYKAVEAGATSISTCSITLDHSSYTYSGSACKPVPTVKDGSTILTIGTDYTLSYSDNKNIGKGTVIVTGKGYYTGSVNKTFTINFASTCKVKSLTNTSKGITVKWNKITGAKGYYIYRKAGSGSYSKIKTISSGSTVSYSDTKVKSKNGTKYTYKVVPYSGSVTGKFTTKKTVRMTAPSIKSVKSSKAKKATVKWKKNSKATGYQIRYSTSKSFKSSKTVTVKGSKKVSKTISKLKKGKKYYVQVRAYKTSSGTKYYSDWSGKKSVKVKKK